jgi:hypothetical protein
LVPVWLELDYWQAILTVVQVTPAFRHSLLFFVEVTDTLAYQLQSQRLLCWRRGALLDSELFFLVCERRGSEVLLLRVSSPFGQVFQIGVVV